MSSARNKTINFPLDEGGEYLSRCILAENYAGEKNATVLGDTFLALKKIEKNSVDLLIADPPYDLNKDFHGKKFRQMGGEEYAEYTERWILAVKPLLKETASIYVCADWRTSIPLGAVLERHFVLRNRITWQREKGRGAGANWKNSMEDIYFATVSDKYTFNLGAVKQRKRVRAPYRENGAPKDWESTESGNFRNTCPSNFWDDITVPYWSMEENTAHPTQKPEKLMAKLILASSAEGDLVLDPFSGSGTTGVTAKKLGRKYIDIEQNPLYCAWAEYRLERARPGGRIQGYEQGVFWERGSGK